MDIRHGPIKIRQSERNAIDRYLRTNYRASGLFLCILHFPMPYAAILWDMDGTLLDTSPLWDRAARFAVAEHGITLTEEEHLGLAGWRLLHDVLAEKGYDAEKIRDVRLTRDNALLPIIRSEAQWREGARDLLSSIKLPKAIVTSAHQYVFDPLSETLDIHNAVDAIVLGDEVHPDFKPHPKGLLLACEKLGVDPAQCIYIGDQEVDLLAAKNARMDAILLRGSHTPKQLTHEKTATNFVELTLLLA
jgi:HAD superfamily hydrolase (TIGR01509 family)